MAAQEAVKAAKVKTKAKAHYLKAKKDRKKRRKATEALKTRSKTSQKPPEQPRLDRDDVSAISEDDEDSDTTVTPATIQLPAHPQSAQDEQTEDIKEPADDVMNVDEEAEEPARAISTQPQRSASPEGLPSFPLPRHPNPPSTSELLRQGLDKALIGAEIVDPSRGLPIPDPGEPDEHNLGLGDRTCRRLRELGIVELFAVQTALLPFLLSPSLRSPIYSPYNPPQDVCVSAPTGSGKTLAYVLPILEILSTRIVTRLRALIVLPTRDLVAQVRETFEAICKGRGLKPYKIGTATGQHSLHQEKCQLVGDSEHVLHGGHSNVDILICTPGRLIDHLHGTPNFTLQHLRFLVIDEADRLITQAFQDWVAQVLAAIQPPSQLSDDTTSPESLPFHDALAPSWSHLSSATPEISANFSEKKESSCQKLLFSATLTRDPSKIAALNLRQPKYFVFKSLDTAVGEETFAETFEMPATLSEHMIVCESIDKPLVLFYLLHHRAVTNALIFTKSAESTTRLMHLFEFFEKSWAAAAAEEEGARQPVIAQAYSSDHTTAERKSILDKFKGAKISVLICSDLVSRGMDISHVSHVVSYDAPIDIRKYVHRVGRTARAGRAGDAWSLVEAQEARHFKKMLTTSDHIKKVKKLRLAEKDLQPLRSHYENALSQLKVMYRKNTAE